MTDTQMHWDDLVKWSEEHHLLAKRLYLVLSAPTDGLGPVLENLDIHVKYQTQLELDGAMFAAGPLSDDDEKEWEGEGVFIYRAASRDDATALAAADPMHANGARSFVVRPWLLNEGTMSVQLYYSGGRPKII